MEWATIEKSLCTDKQCREYLATIRWKYGFVCPRCKNTEAWKTTELKYKCKKCGYKMSVTAGTIFQNSHTPLNKWFKAIWIMCESENKVSANTLQRELSLGSNRTSQKLFKYLKSAKQNVQLKKYKTIPSPKLKYTVEVFGDILFSFKDKAYIISAVEKIGTKTGRIHMQVINRNKDEIVDFIKNNIERYQNIETDLNDSEKKIGIISNLTLPSDIQRDYNRILKSPTYEFASTRKIRSAFSGWLNEQSGSDFEQYCKRFCEEHNSKFISVTFEELIESLLK